MIRTQNKKIIMVEGDFGLTLPITITGTEIASDETIKFIIKNIDNTTIMTKEYKNIINNTFDLTFTEQESVLLKKGKYIYTIDWLKDDVFLGNVINNEIFEVEGK